MDGSTKTQRVKLVLLPGMDGTGDLFSKFAAALAGEFEIATVRYPTEESLSYSELEDFVRVACPTSGPFVLLAESYSTPLAIKYAASNPENLEGVVLCAGFATSPMRGWRRFLGWLLAPVMFRIPLPDLVVKLWLAGPEASSPLIRSVRSAVSSVRPKAGCPTHRALCDVWVSPPTECVEITVNLRGSSEYF